MRTDKTYSTLWDMHEEATSTFEKDEIMGVINTLNRMHELIRDLKSENQELKKKVKL